MKVFDSHIKQVFVTIGGIIKTLSNTDKTDTIRESTPEVKELLEEIEDGFRAYQKYVELYSVDELEERYGTFLIQDKDVIIALILHVLQNYYSSITEISSSLLKNTILPYHDKLCKIGFKLSTIDSTSIEHLSNAFTLIEFKEMVETLKSVDEVLEEKFLVLWDDSISNIVYLFGDK